MKYSDISQLTPQPRYSVTVPWSDLKQQLDGYNDNGLLNLDPDFQRGHVWSEYQQVAYVEYVLRGGKSSRELQLSCSSWMKTFDTPIYLVDGKQRLNAVLRFLNNEIKAFGHYYNEFEGRLPFGANFVFHMNDLPDYKSVLNWYLELNDGGTHHTPEELDKVRQMTRCNEQFINYYRHMY